MKSEKFTLTKHMSFGKFIKTSMLSALLTIWYSGLMAQACPLACNNLVQVSMDEDCRVTITPDMMLEGQGVAPSCNYVVEVLGTNGLLLPSSPDVTSANIGQTLTVRVRLGANSCWGTIKIEDKLAPTLTCPDPITISCWDNRTFPLPVAQDWGCGSVSVSLLSDVTTELECSNLNRARRVIRYQGKDQSGNLSAICERIVVYSRVTLAQVRFPKNYDGSPGNRPHLECDGGWAWNPYKTVPSVPFPTADWDLNNNHYPDPAETGGPFINDPGNISGYIRGYRVGTPVPSGSGLPQCTSGNLVGYDVATGLWITQCDNNSGTQNFLIDTFYNPIVGSNNICKINTTFSDTKVEICEQSFKILRFWTVLDWCTGGVSSKYQIIKVIDDEGPRFNLPPRVPSPICETQAVAVLSANPYTCKADPWQVPKPIYVFDCDGVTNLKFTVKFKKAETIGGIDCQDPGEEIPFTSKDGETEVVGTNGNYTIRNLPFGRTWVRYYVEDECGNVNFMTTEVDVIDRTPPVPVCNEFTVVTLSNNGWAHVYAESFDNGSHDNCSDVTLDVRRMTPGCAQSTTVWSEFVQICCDDVGREVMVELRVTDAYGNSNTCMIKVNTQDKVPPIITCPIDKTINCTADTTLLESERPVFSTTALSTPYFTDNCTGARMSWRNNGTIDNCGQGVISRIFTVTDRGGRTATCVQTITVRNNTPYAGPTSWPTSPREVVGCMNVDTDPSKTGKPVLNINACSQVAYTYEDQVFNFVDGVCFKILRRWTVIDWCKFAPNRNPNGALYPNIPTEGVNMWSYTQIIKVTETDKPVIATCSKADTDAFGENCNGFVDLKNSATDCTPAAQLRWSYVIDLRNDGKFDVKPTGQDSSFVKGSTNDASNTYPVGSHRITWTVEDMCGNQSTCSYVFRVLDKKKPTPYCKSAITIVVMPTSGSIDIWAIDFNLASVDNCPGKLWYTFNGERPVANRITQEHYFKGDGLNATKAEYDAGNAQIWKPLTCSSGKLYTCDDRGDNTENMSVWDASGNTDYCTVTLTVQANGTACAGARMAGDVGTESNKMVEEVAVTLRRTEITETSTIRTNASGHYEFSGMPEGESYTITPEKDIDPLNGVSTLDLVLIQRHILGSSRFTSPYKFIAADVNKDKKVSASDLVELRKMILGIFSEFPNNKSWRFIDKAFNISDIENPWNASEFISVQNFNTSVMNNNFVAIKIGDVNESADVNLTDGGTQNRSAKTLNFVAENQFFTAGETVKMEVTADQFTQIAGAQWTLNFDPYVLEFSNIIPGALQISKENSNITNAHEGKLSFSWNELDGSTFAKDQILYTIEFRATANNTIANVVKMTSDITKAEAYTDDLSEIKLGLTFQNNQLESDFVLEQNNPNPFSESTIVSFNLPQSGPAQLTIYDVTGKVLKVIKGDYPKGRTELKISVDDVNAQGVMFYKLESNGFEATKKMIYLSK